MAAVAAAAISGCRSPATRSGRAYFFPVLEVCPGVLEVSPAAGVDEVAPAFPAAPFAAVGVDADFLEWR